MSRHQNAYDAAILDAARHTLPQQIRRTSRRRACGPHFEVMPFSVSVKIDFSNFSDSTQAPVAGRWQPERRPYWDALGPPETGPVRYRQCNPGFNIYLDLYGPPPYPFMLLWYILSCENSARRDFNFSPTEEHANLVKAQNTCGSAARRAGGQAGGANRGLERAGKANHAKLHRACVHCAKLAGGQARGTTKTNLAKQRRGDTRGDSSCQANGTQPSEQAGEAQRTNRRKHKAKPKICELQAKAQSARSVVRSAGTLCAAANSALINTFSLKQLLELRHETASNSTGSLANCLADENSLH